MLSLMYVKKIHQFLSSINKDARKRKSVPFYPRDAMLARVLASPVSVCLSVTSRCSIEVVERIELDFGTEASFDQSYTAF